MVKIKMAFRPGVSQFGDKEGGGGGTVDLEMAEGGGRTRRSSAGGDHANLNVSNFGEFGADDEIGGDVIVPVLLVDPSSTDAGVLHTRRGDAGAAAASAAGGAFAIPFPLEPTGATGGGAGEWILADDGASGIRGDGEGGAGVTQMMRRGTQQGGGGGGPTQDSAAVAAANMTLDSDLSGMGQSRMHPEEEEGWSAFDPDADMDIVEDQDRNRDEEDDDDRHVFEPDEMVEDQGAEAGKRKRRMSDVELVRGAGDSLASEREMHLGRASAVGGGKSPSEISDNEFAIGQDDGHEISNIRLPDDEDDEKHQLGAAGQESSSLNVSLDGSSGIHRRDSSIGGFELDASGEATEGAMQKRQVIEGDDEQRAWKKRKRGDGPRRMRRRRKIVIDNNETELTSEHIRAMLRDTSDITLQSVVHPADLQLLVEDLNAKLVELDDIVYSEHHCSEGGLSLDDIDLWARLRSISIIKGVQWPQKLRAYMDNLSALGDVPLYDEMAL